MKIESEDNQMLESMDSLINLQSAVLEGARQTTQNANQVNQTVQQQGLQTQQSKDTLQKQKIQAAYAKVDLKQALK